MAPFGLLLRRLRERSGLSQEQLAERAGISAKAVSALERGERQHPYPHTVRSLATALGLYHVRLLAMHVDSDVHHRVGPPIRVVVLSRRYAPRSVVRSGGPLRSFIASGPLGERPKGSALTPARCHPGSSPEGVT